MDLHSTIGRINEKLQQLVKQYQALQKENERLKLELEKKAELANNLQRQAESFQEQASLLKASAGQLDEDNRRTLEKKIDMYIREIDRCIAFLEKTG